MNKLIIQTDCLYEIAMNQTPVYIWFMHLKQSSDQDDLK